MHHQTNIKRRFLAGLIDYTVIISATWFYIYTVGKETIDGYVVNGLPALVPDYSGFYDCWD